MSCYITIISVRKKDVKRYNLLNANSINEFLNIASVLSYSSVEEFCNSNLGRKVLDFFRLKPNNVEEHAKKNDDVLFYIKDINDYVELFKILDKDYFEEFNTPKNIKGLKNTFKEYYMIAKFED